MESKKNKKTSQNTALSKQVGGIHYKGGEMQPIELIEGVRMYGSCSSILRYIYRHKDKNGLQDLNKILHYASFIEMYGNWYGGCVKNTVKRHTIDNLKTNKLFFDFISKNPQLDENQKAVITALRDKDLARVIEYTKKEIDEVYGGENALKRGLEEKKEKKSRKYLFLVKKCLSLCRINKSMD